MGIRRFRPITPSQRNMSVLDFKEITKKTSTPTKPPDRRFGFR